MDLLGRFYARRRQLDQEAADLQSRVNAEMQRQRCESPQQDAVIIDACVREMIGTLCACVDDDELKKLVADEQWHDAEDHVRLLASESSDLATQQLAQTVVIDIAHVRSVLSDAR